MSEPQEGYDPSAGERAWPTQPVPSVQGAAAPGAGMPGEQPDAGAQQQAAQPEEQVPGQAPGQAPGTQVPGEHVPGPHAPEVQSVQPVYGPQPTHQGALPGMAATGQEQAQGPWSYGGYSVAPGWGGTYAGPPYAGPPPVVPAPRRNWRVPVTMVAGIALIAAGAGVGVGYAVWHSTSPTVSAASTGQNNGTTNGNGNGNGTGNGSGTSPFGLPNGTGNGSGTGNGTGNGSTGTGSGSTSEGSGGPSDVSAIAQKVDPGLVDVNSTFSYQSAEGAGTGIVLSSTGEILTNNHVIDGATSISVTDIGNGKTYTATVVGYDDSRDIAVLQLQGASGLTTANIGDSSTAAVGQAIVGIGNAGGTGGTPSSAGGSITALNQSITASNELDGTDEQLSGLIEVNADIQSGDSGGPVVNTSGQVLGMDTAGSESYSLGQSQSGAGGDGYAIPINTAISIAKQMEAGQSSAKVHVGETAFLGVLLSSSSSGSQGSGSGGFGSGSGNGGSASTVSGAEISQAVSGGAAAAAGLTGGDVITSLDGQSVTSAASLSTIVSTLKVGQSVSIGYTDSYGQSHTGTVTMTSGPPA